jgi:hypothetical protein
MPDVLLWTGSKKGFYVRGGEKNAKLVELYLLSLFIPRFPLIQPLLYFSKEHDGTGQGGKVFS